MKDMEILFGLRANYVQKQIKETLLNDLNPSTYILEIILGLEK
jgi:hypothetical protein